MKRKSMITAALLLTALTLSAQTGRKPNLVLFMADDCSYYDLGCYGSVDSKTPHIDKFAKEGILCGDKGQATEMEALDHQYRNAQGKAGEF